MDGLRPSIAAEGRRLYVSGRHGARHDDLGRHARHAQDVVQAQKDKKAIKMDTDLHKAALPGRAQQQKRHLSHPQYHKGGCRG